MKTAATLLIAFGVMVTAPGAAFAQGTAYPSKPIQLVAPFPPGASTDLAARYFGPRLQEALGQTVVVENRPGAGGILGSTYAAKAAPDGHTLLVASSSVILGPLMQKAPAYDAVRDFVPVITIFQHPFVLVANKQMPGNLVELTALAKANPGKFNIATLGTYNDLMSEMFKKAAGLDIQLVHYRGAAENMVGVIRGDSHLTFTGYSVVQSQLAAGEIRVIGAASLRRSALTPNLPTLAEQGLPGFEVMNVIGIMAPAGTPQPIVARLNSEIARILNTPESKNFLNTRGNDTADDTSAEAYAAYIRKDTEKFKQIIEATGFKKL